ncbi:MAG: patatin-like phospholipase family protein [Pseudomonadota bacterium]
MLGLIGRGVLGLATVFTIAVALTSTSIAACGPSEGRPKIGLALSGGGALGATHIGVLKVLEENRIPVDCIAGTSMGAIVGGLYATGMRANQLETTLKAIDWREMFTDRPPRKQRDFRRKLEDEGGLLPYKIGIGGDKPALPRGIILGQELTLALRALSVNASAVKDFDRLAIPFRAVAADIETGKTVVLDDGDLATAMRASMAVSGVFPPVDIGGRLLVDGGLSNNLPIDVVREMGADIVIVVDIPTKLKPREELSSASAIIAQSLSVMISRSSEQQLETMTDRDILIQPDLGDASSASFELIAEMIQPGVEATRAQLDRLRGLVLAPAAYDAYAAAQPAVPALPTTIGSIRLENNTSIADEVIWSRLSIKPGDRFDTERLEQDISKIYGLDYFETITYRTEATGENLDLVIVLEEKSIGLDTVRAGLNLQYDNSGDTAFSVSSQFRFANLDGLGAEALIDVSLGRENSLEATYLQPLDAATRYYVFPRLSFSDEELGQFSEGERVRELRSREAIATVGVARQISTWGFANLSLSYGLGKLKVQSGEPLPGDKDYTIAQATADFRYDTVDDLYFPKDGEAGRFTFVQNLDELGADTSEKQIRGAVSTTNSFGRNTVRLQAAGGATFDGNNTPQDSFQLGGLFSLSGFAEGELTGSHFGLGNILVYRDIGEQGPLFDLPLFLGASLEGGAIWNDGDGKGPLRWSGSLFAGADTPIGPLYFGYGIGGAERHALYLALGLRL